MKNVLLILFITLACSTAYAQRASRADLPKGKAQTCEKVVGCVGSASPWLEPSVAYIDDGEHARVRRQPLAQQRDLVRVRG